MKLLFLVLIVGFVANLTEGSLRMKRDFNIDKQIIEMAKQLNKKHGRVDEKRFISLLEDIKDDLLDKGVNNIGDLVRFDMKNKISDFIENKLKGLTRLGISQKTADKIASYGRTLVDKMALKMDQSDDSDQKRQYIPVSDVEKEFLHGWREDKRNAPIVPNNDVQYMNTLIEPLSQDQRPKEEVAYFDKEITPLHNAAKKPKPDDGNATTKVRNSVLKVLIDTYRRFQKVEGIYKANQMGLKNFK